jgi:rhodanese-related sulfurtransferase
MSKLKIYSVLLAFASLFLYAVQPAWAFTEASAQNAYNAVSAGNGVIIDVRSVEEHNGCNALWQGKACPTAEAANRGAPEWKDPDGVWMQAAVIPWWISTIGNFTTPQNVTEFRNSFQALLDSGYITKSSPVYLLCRSGARSRAASGWIEANMGFTNVHNIDGDGTGSKDGGMIEWNGDGLPVAWITAINRGWKAPQIFSIAPVDGATETASNTIPFKYGILEPTWGYLSYGDIVRISLYMDGSEVASTTTDPTTSGALWTIGSFAVDVPNGKHTWDVRAEAKVLTSGGANIFDFNRLAAKLGPGGRSITVNTVSLEPNISVSPTSLDFGGVTAGNTSAAQTVTVKNTGTADLNVGSLLTTGDFSIQSDNCSGATVAASGGSCTVDVVFEPTADGALTGTLSIPSDDSSTPNVDVALSGTGTSVSEPNISVSPAAKSFGNVTVGDTSAAQIFTVSNTGTADLNISAVTKTGDFSITSDSCSGITVPSSGNCTVGVLFAPGTEGDLTGTLSITSDDPDTPVLTVALSGTGVAPTTPKPNISVTPATLAFGDVVVGDTSAPQTVTVKNTGTADLTVTGILLTGDADDFSVKSTTCTDPTLTPGDSCSADIVFKPTTVGGKTGIAAISSNDPDTAVVDVPLSGTGIPTPEPDISVSPASLTFGDVIIGNTSTKTVTVTNAGSAPLNVGTLDVTGGDFSTANDNCSDSAVAVGDNCTVDVVFTPSAEGASTGKLSIPSDDPDTSNVDVALSGTGEAPQPDIKVSTRSVDFGSVTVGDSGSKVVTVKNDGTADLNINSVSSLNDPFSTTDGCTGTLAPSESCAVTISFAPLAAGTFSGSLVITSNDPDEASVTVAVSGEGAEVSANQPPTKPELLYPGNGDTGVPVSNLPLVWKKATDPEGAAITYEVKYCEDTNLTKDCKTVDGATASAKGTDRPMFAGLGAGAGLLLFGFVFAGSTRRRKMVLLLGMMILTAMFLVSCGDNVTTDNTTGTVISGLDTNTTYYWQVTASDGQSGTSSDVWHFKTESGTRRGMH